MKAEISLSLLALLAQSVAAASAFASSLFALFLGMFASHTNTDSHSQSVFAVQRGACGNCLWFAFDFGQFAKKNCELLRRLALLTWTDMFVSITLYNVTQC